jgi:hypothetical protein
VLEDFSLGAKGDEISSVQVMPFDFPALVQAGYVEEITPKVACPACDEDKSVKKADVPHFQKQETLTEHYASEHPALAAPDFEEVV